jgi:predicted AAA+ superfamily ATPase
MIPERVIAQVIEEQRKRVLEGDAGIPRGLLPGILERLKLKEIVVISGIRRCGKSTLLKQIVKHLMSKGIGEGNILYVNLEDERLDGFALSDFNRMYEIYLSRNSPRGRVYIFLDEVQEIEKWEKWVNRMQEFEDVKILITGSNARLMSSEISSLLTGRNITYALFPFSFSEICRPESLYDTREIAKAKSAFRDYIEFGGFPEAYLNRDRDILGTYYRDIINRDIVSRNRIRETKTFGEFARYAISCVGRYVTFHKLKNVFDLGSVNTAKKYLGFMEESYLIFSVESYSRSVAEITKSPRKIYAADHALADYFSLKEGRNMGQIAENIVFIELKRMQPDKPPTQIFYYQHKGRDEVDFLLKEGEKVRQLIQVCWDLADEETKRREIKGLLKAMDEFRLKKGLVITEDFEGKETLKGKGIVYTPLWKWLLQK